MSDTTSNEQGAPAASASASPAVVVAEGPAKLSRDEMRQRVLSQKVDKRLIDFFGMKVEVRQGTIDSVMDNAGDEKSNKERTIDILLKQVYIPGTNDLVFEAEDAEALADVPWGPDMTRLSSTVGELTGVKALDTTADKAKFQG